MPVLGEGPLDCKIAIVSEAPGADEARTGRPFIGQAGRLLDQILANTGVSRSEVYITNVVKEQPRGNAITEYIEITGGKVHKKTTAYDYWEKELYTELQDVKANVIVATGAIPLYALTRKFGIMKYRGSILEAVDELHNRKIIPCIHPEAALRQYMLRHFIMIDFARIFNESKIRGIIRPKRELQLEPIYPVVLDYLRSVLENRSPIGFDIEVFGEEISCLAIAKSPLDCMCIAFRVGGANNFTTAQEETIWALIAEIMEHPDIPIVTQNGYFDATFLCRRYGIRTRNFEDTMIGQGILCPDFPKGLDMICSLYTQEPYYKDDGKKWWSFGQGSEIDFFNYNALDSVVCLEAIDPIKHDLKTIGSLKSYQNQVALIEPLICMSDRGVKIDIEGLRKQTIECEAEIDKVHTKLQELIPGVNPDSPKQVMDYFYVRKGIKPYLKDGRPTADEKALKMLARRGYEEATLLLRRRKLKKLDSTYYQMKFDSDDRMRCSWNPVGTKQGRLSSSKTIFGTGGNMQNLPPEMKKFMLFDEGYMGYEIDLSQAENRVVAYIANDFNMIDAFEQNQDIHCKTAGYIFGKPMDQISDEKGSCSIGSGLFSERFWGKKANHANNYDIGPRQFGLIYEIPDKDSKFIINRYHMAYPGVHTWQAQTREQLNKNRTLTNLLGRRRMFYDRWGDSLFKEAYSFVPQSTVADMINQRGLIYIYYDPKTFEHLELLLQVHDSIVFQIPLSQPIEYHMKIVNLICTSLQQPLTTRNKTFSIPADVAMGKTYGTMKKLSRGYDVGIFQTVFQEIQDEREY